MSKQVFWDASAFIALGKQRDMYHQRAIEVSRALAKAGSRIVTTNAVLTEVANGLSAVDLRQYAKQLIESTQETALMEQGTIVHVSPELWERGWELYQSRPDKAWGLTDCISMVVMRDYEIDAVFTADHHFTQAGFTRLLK